MRLQRQTRCAPVAWWSWCAASGGAMPRPGGCERPGIPSRDRCWPFAQVAVLVDVDLCRACATSRHRFVGDREAVGFSPVFTRLHLSSARRRGTEHGEGKSLRPPTFAGNSKAVGMRMRRAFRNWLFVPQVPRRQNTCLRVCFSSTRPASSASALRSSMNPAGTRVPGVRWTASSRFFRGVRASWSARPPPGRRAGPHE